MEKEFSGKLTKADLREAAIRTHKPMCKKLYLGGIDIIGGKDKEIVKHLLNDRKEYLEYAFPNKNFKINYDEQTIEIIE